MRNFGIEHFHIEPIEEVKDEKQLPAREQYWIEFYDSYQNGYNGSIGGDGSQLYDYDQIWNLWEKGLTIKQISSTIPCNDFVVRTVLDIHQVSTEDRKERSHYRQEAAHKPYRRVVEQIDISTGKVLKSYESVQAASEEIGCDSSYLSRTCRKNKIAFGYRWRYRNDMYVKKDFASKPVCQVDLDTGRIINVFPSTLAAAKAIHGDSSYLSKVCRGIQKSSKGFGWKYIHDVKEQDVVDCLQKRDAER